MKTESQLRQALEQKHDEFCAALSALGRQQPRTAKTAKVEEAIYLLLGIVTYWRSLPTFNKQQIRNVEDSLSIFTVAVTE